VEFFDDLISSMQQLVEQQHLRTLDQLNCIHTVFVILSGDGRALNIDPCNFYRAIYRILPRIAVERDPGIQRELLGSALRCLDLMLIGRRKQIGDARVAAFIKRLVLLALVVPSSVTTAMLAASRKYFITFPGLTSSLMDEEGSVCGVYNGNSDDPDHCNALISTIIGELDRLLQHPNPIVVAFARNLRHQLPTTGQHRLPPELNSRKPSLWLDDERWHDDEPSPFLSEILAMKGREKKASGKMQQRSLNTGDVCSRVIAWLESSSNGIVG